MKTLNLHKNGKPCIYSIKNIVNDKLYIGSAIGHYRRKGQHFYMLRRNIHFNIHLQSSWNKYGEDKFIFEILEFVEDIEKLQEKEEYYIDKFDVLDAKNGYNARKDCKTNLGLKWPEESKRKFSESKKGIVPPHLDYVKIAERNRKKVIGIHKDSKETMTFNSLKEASNYFNIDPSNISKAVNKVIKTCQGFIWDFVEKSTSNNSVNSEKLLAIGQP